MIVELIWSSIVNCPIVDVVDPLLLKLSLSLPFSPLKYMDTIL